MVCCKYCDDKKVIRYGIVRAKQRYFCKKCHRCFSNPKSLKNTRHDRNTINKVLDLYYSGLSLRTIVTYLKVNHNIKVSHTTIWRWIIHYTKKAINKTENLKFDFSKVWHIDETMIKVKGGNCYNWVIIDANSRFIIASNLTLTRTKDECDKILIKGKKIAKTYPRFIFSDGYKGYKGSVEETFENTEHIKVIKISDKQLNNNIVERHMGYIKSFYKTKRAFNNLHDANVILNGLNIYYNFLRPHSSLNGKTPAKVLGCELDVSKRWLSLIS